MTGNLCARWLTPYSTRIDVVGQGRPAGLLYHAADGRSHRYPWLGIGQRNYDPVALYQETGRTQANGLLQTMKLDSAGRLIEQQLGAIAQAGQKERYFFPDQYRPDVQVACRQRSSGATAMTRPAN